MDKTKAEIKKFKKLEQEAHNGTALLTTNKNARRFVEFVDVKTIHANGTELK